MKTRHLLYYCMGILLALFLSSFIGCSSSEVLMPQAKITFSDENTDVVFESKEKTHKISFHSTRPWKLSPITVDWLKVTPVSGEAGDNELTINITGDDPTEERQYLVKITSEEIDVTFKVIQKVEKAVEITGIKINNPPPTIFLGETIEMKVDFMPPGAKPAKLTWSSSEPDIISVDENGVIKGIQKGKATITASLNDFTDMCEIEAIGFITKGDGTIYSFVALSQNKGSGITKENGDFVVNYSFEIAERDILKIDGTQTIKIKDDITITVRGKIDFTPSSATVMTSYDDNSQPKEIYITGENAGGEIKNMTFINVPFKVFGGHPFNVDNSTFKDVKRTASAISLGGAGLVTISNSRFLENGYPAISSGANTPAPLIFKGNYLFKNSHNARNRPQINVIVGGSLGPVEIVNNEIIGPAETTTIGGIAISNLLGIVGTNVVLIEGNKVRDCRYGITTNGVMNVKIINNELVDNKYETNPNLGGSGISISNGVGGQKVVISGNLISGHLWGITNIGNVSKGTGAMINLGNLTPGDNYNPGGNIFKDNGNTGVLYDFYNNSPLDAFAQGNKWNVSVQDEESIEQVVFHKKDDPTLGLVTFMPAAN